MINFLKSKTAKAAVGLIAVFMIFAASVQTASAAITSTLRKGSSGAQVAELQAGLNSMGFANPALTADGKFGAKTDVAVKAYQASKGLTADGIFGAKSRAAWTGTPSTGGFPAGCTSAVGFSPTTGLPCNGQTGNNQTGPVTAMLATTNPASGVLVAGQATADLAHFAFSGNGTVTNVTLKRTGVSADSVLSNIYLFDGATRLTDASSVSNNGMISFNIPAGIFTVGGSKVISVKSDIAASTSGQTVGVMLQSFTTSGSTTAITANLSGNIHSIASATLATVAAGTVTPTGATLNPGAGVTVWQSTLSIGNRDVWMKRMALRNIGSAPASSFQNFKLYVNGVQVATAAGMDAMGYVTFDMNAAPVMLASGSRVVRVDADIVSGASRSVRFSLRQAADVDFVDSSFGVNVSPTSTPWVAAADNTISGATGGSLTIERDVTSPSGNVSEGTSDKVLGIFKVTAFGEPMKIENLRATFTSSDGSVSELRNGRILIGGVQYGSTATLNEDSHSAPAYTQYTTNYTVMPGTPVMVELRADMYDNDGTDNLSNGDTIVGVIAAGSSNVQKVDSLGSVSSPSTAVSANTLTVADASMALTKNGTYANQTVVIPATNMKIGSWNLAGSSTEDVLLTTLSIDIDEASGTEFDEGDLTNMYVVVKNAGTIVSQPSPLATVSATGNNFSVNYTLLKNSNITVELYANLSDDGADSTIDSGDSFNTNLTISGTAMVSGSAVCADDDNACDGTTGDSTGVDGQTIASGAASVTATQDASTPVAAIVADNQTITAAAFKFDAVTSSYNVTDITFTLADATVAQTVELYDGATLVASRPGAATVTFSGLNWNVPANTNKILTVKLVLGGVGIGAGSTGASQLVTLTAFTAVNASTGVSAAGTESNPAGTAMYAYAATPTVTNVALPTTLLAAGTQTVSKFSIASNGGTIGWKKLIFTIAKNISGTDTLASATLWDADTNTQVAGVAAFTGTVDVDNDTAGGLTFVATNEQQISGSKTYVLKMVVAGTITDGDNLSVNIAQPSSFVAATDYTTVAATAATLVWTDVSASGHSTSTSDWNNDYLVKFLPTDTQTLTK